MTINALVSVSCPDRVGLVAAIAGRLFDLGGNLGDTTFAVLGGAAEFVSVVELADDVALSDVEAALRALPELEGAKLSVVPFQLAPVHGPTARVTHRITVSGGDRPGLIARLSEVFVEFEANIVRLDAERIPGGPSDQYTIRIELHVPSGKAPACLSTAANTAGSLGLACHWTEV